jgi:hypothetical protein
VTPLQATELVYETVRTGWTATTSANTSFENETWTPPRDAASVRVVVRDLPPLALTHGPTGQRTKRHRAFIVAQIFVPLAIATGVAAARTLAQTFAALFEAKEIASAAATYPNSIQTEPAAIRGPLADGDLYQLNVEVPFTFDETI